MGNIDWATYKKRLLTNSPTKRDYDISKYRSDFDKAYILSPSYSVFAVNNNDIGVLVRSCEEMDEKTFTAPYGTDIKLGDVVIWKNMHWLVIEKDITGEVTFKGKIKQCNIQIRWQNPKTKEIISRWCIATKPYYSNIKEGTVITTSQREYKIQIPYDEETILVNIDRRFILEMIDNKPKAYKLTSSDTITNQYEGIEGGFLVWNLEQDQFDKNTDNEELLICDYAPPTNDEIQNNNGCIINGSDILKCNGYSRSYSATFYNNGSVDETVTPLWNVGADGIISYDVGLSGTLSVSTTDESLIGKKIILTLSDENGNYNPVTKNVEVVSYYG